MNTIDIIFIVVMGLCVILGFFKGLIRQIMTVLGIIAVATLTATLAPYVQKWFANIIVNENTRSLVAMLVAALIIVAGYTLVAILITKMLKRVKVLKVLNRVLGAVLGLVVAYLAFAVIFALFTETGSEFLPGLKKMLGESLDSSWVVQHIYAHNFFGRWVIVGIAQKLLDSLLPQAASLLQSA